MKEVVGVIVPGAFLLRPACADVPGGHEPPLAQHTSVLRDAEAFAHVPKGELTPVVNSLQATLRQGAYHLERFQKLRAQIESRRRRVPGDVLFDGLGSYIHFELRALTGAYRTALDELTYLLARQQGATHSTASKWKTAGLFDGSEDRAGGGRAHEILRDHADWFDWLNAYRNSLYHHGWESGSGVYDVAHGSLASRTPSMNCLLVPDRESLRGKSKAFERTWAEGNTVDTLATKFEDGMASLLRGLFVDAWGVPAPKAGTAPEERLPTMVVALARPIYATVGPSVIVPLFSSKRTALAFKEGKDLSDAELHALPVVRTETQQNVIAFCTAGVEELLSDEEEQLHVMVDPAPFVEGTSWRASHHSSIPVTNVTSDPWRMLQMVVDTDELYVWRKPMIVERD